MKEVYKVLVPTDFTSVADTAINHAIRIAKIMNGEIVVLHVIERKSMQLEAEEKLKPIVNKINQNENIPTAGRVVTGDIFEDISNVAELEGARLIIMGTHGRKGIQHFTGSYAMKVITSSAIPFIVVQDKKVPKNYKNIVFPIDFKAETKLKIALTASMAEHFGSKVNIFAEKESDPFHKKQVENNLQYAKKFFSDNNIPFSVKFGEDDGDFVKQIIHYAVSVEADMLAVLNLNYRSISHFLKNDEEALISNEAQIPVLMVNPSKSFLDKSPLFSRYQTF